MKPNEAMMSGPVFAVLPPPDSSCQTNQSNNATLSHSCAHDHEEAGKNDVSLFLSFCRVLCFCLSQQPDVQRVAATFKQDRGRGFPGFPGNFPGVYGVAG